ncbi:probable polyketide synthase 16 [Chanos chanos]|uniref:Probable polyketide synthase 16 n=1 Tax=Chanos chanos TaxID=29144 RepID=A0A6J2UUM7_CHACN|nr:probable polyketide synthase 16 [Chanos chanos]
MDKERDDIAVVGIGCNFPGGEGLRNFWKVLFERRNCAIDIPEERFDRTYWYDPDDSKPGKTRTTKAALIDGFNEFDHKFFGITDAEANDMDPQQKLLLQCTYRALEDAGIPMEKISGTRTGVYIGLMNRDYEILLSNYPNSINHYYGTGTAMSIAANRISFTFNLTGPSVAMDSACSSSLVALHLACQALRQGDCEMALCGGVSCIFDPKIFVTLSKAKMISPEGTSKPFSNRADGYGRGEGCGIVLLKPLKKVSNSDNVWGIINKTAVNQDGRTVTPITKPSTVQQEELLRRIYSTDIDLSHIQYIEAHGTGTPVGDPIEAGSISRILAKARPPGSGPLYIGSVKSNIGHTESAAGVAGLIKVLLMMKHETIAPTVFYSEDSSSIDAKALNLKIPTKALKWENKGEIGRVAGINNFGFGGTNAHAIVRQSKYTNKQIPRLDIKKSKQIFVLSAASEKSLAMMIQDTAEHIHSGSIADLQTLAYTSACRRSHFKHRHKKAFPASSLTDLKEKLISAQDKKIGASKPDPKLVFVFCGNGVTYRGMCRQLLKEEPLFRDKVKEIEALFQSYKSTNLLEKLESDTDESGDFSKPEVVQPLLFTIQVAITSLLNHWGVRPDAILGHSVGEVAAAHCSGLLSLEDAVKVIYYRSLLQSKVTGGKMLVVSNMAVSEILKLLPSYSGKVCLAAYNSPQSCTLSGDADAISSLHKNLSNSVNSQKLFLHVLDVPAAYHSHMMDPILLNVEESIGSLQEHNLVTELFSTVTGKRFCPPDFVDGKYWAKNIREPVAFEQAVKSAVEDKKNVIFVEIGPRRALHRNIIETLGNGTTVLCSVQPDKDHEAMLTLVSKLFEFGVSVDWDKFYIGFEAPPADLPRYHFDTVKKPISVQYAPQHSESNHPVLTQTGKGGNEFTCDLSSESISYISDHKNNGVAIIPGSLYAELGLAAFMASAKPKVPLSTLKLNVSFQSPFLFTQNSTEMKVKLESAGNETTFKIYSKTATFAAGSIEYQKGRLVEVSHISLECVYERCKSMVSSDELYKSLDLGGFQYGSVFRNKSDVRYGEEFREAISLITVPEELLPQLHEFYIHPVVLDYLMQMTLITVNGSEVKPSFPSGIGSMTVVDHLQDEMVIYLKAIEVTPEYFEVCGCFTDKEGRVLVELKNIMVKYLGGHSNVVEENFYHNEFSVVSENIRSSNDCRALVFADQLGVSKALQRHLSPASRYISPKHSKTLLQHGFAGLLTALKISDVKKNFQEIIFLWGTEQLTSHETEAVLENVANCCENFRLIVAALKAMKFAKSIRVVTCQSAENTVNSISPGFSLCGMTRACAAEISNLSFQLIDISSVSTENIKALAQVISSYPCSKYPEVVVKDGQILKPRIICTPTMTMDNAKSNVHSKNCENYILQTADPHRMTSLSALPSCNLADQAQEKSVEIRLDTICVHSSDYFPVSVTDFKFGQTMYWSKHTTQNHKLLALDFSGTVTAVGRDVSKLKVGDQIVSCYPVAASGSITIPETVCFKTKRLPWLRDNPCASYCALAWEILQKALPKAKQQRKLGIVSPVSDSGLLKVLIVTASKSGWDTVIGREFSGLLQNENNFDALVLLPPFDKSVFTEACKISGVKDVITVCKNKPSFLTENIFSHCNDNVRTHTIQMSSILDKGTLRAHMPYIYKWLKGMHLNRRVLDIPFTVCQKGTSESIDLLAVQESESYFSSRTMYLVVMSNGDEKKTLSEIPFMRNQKQMFKKNSMYIVTGGLSGLGFETVKFIAQRGGGYIIILSRSHPSPAMQEEINSLTNQFEAVIVSLQCDVSVPAQVEKVVADIGQRFPACPTRGVFHSAVVLHDALIENLNKALFEKVLRPKVNGALNLHRATRRCKLDYFVCYSSITAFIGNASQTNYAAANSFLDMFCHYRRHLGLAGQSINWGALNLGLLLDKDHFQKFLESKGMMVMGVNEIHQSLEKCLLLNKPQQVVCKFSFKNLRNHVLSQNNSLAMRLSELVEEGLGKNKLSDVELGKHLGTPSSVAPPAEYIKSLLSETLDIRKDELTDDVPLSGLGIDSMLAMTLQNRIFQERDVNIPIVKLLDPNSTMLTLVSILTEVTQKNLYQVNDTSFDQRNDIVSGITTKL